MSRPGTQASGHGTLSFPSSPRDTSGVRGSTSSSASHPYHTSGRTRSMDCVGLDTFRGTGGMLSTASRMSLYSKNGGDVSLDVTGVALRVESPISGDLLVTPVAKNRPGVKDPVSGTPMRYHGDAAVVQTPADANNLMRSRKFYIDKDVDITIQTLRATTKVSKYTNEKVGTAGTPTGMDPALLFYHGRRQT